MGWGAQMQDLYERLYTLSCNVASRGVITRVNDGSKMQGLQLRCLDGEVIEGAERFQQYGFTAHPHPGSEALTVFVGADRSHPVILAVDDRRYRVQGLKSGEVCIYTDEGDSITLKRERRMEVQTLHLDIKAVEDVTVSTKVYNVNASESVTFQTPVWGLGGVGGCVATLSAHMSLRGHMEQQGGHVSSGDQVAAGISQTGHTHTGVQPGSANTGEPQ